MKSLSVLQLLFIMALSSHGGHCVQFNRKTTGIDFSVYVKKSENGAPIPGWKSYTINDVKTMLEVISDKFSRVATYGVGADNVPYQANKTYYESNAQAMTAEAAAMINRDRNEKVLTIVAGIWESDFRQQMESEMNVALESAQIANRIYPGTVEGFVFSHNEIGTKLTRTRDTLRWIRSLKSKAAASGLKIGTRQKCYGLYTETPDEETDSGKLLALRQKIVAESDFIICETEPGSHNVMSGPKNGFLTVGYDLLTFRNDFKKLNPQIEVMGQTKWPSKGDNWWENVENMRDYWIEADQWATENNFHMWLFEAFDNPWKTWSTKEAYYGWWKLRSNNETDKKEGYVEKISHPEEEDNIPTADDRLDKALKWIRISFAVGTVIIFALICVVSTLYLKVNQVQLELAREKLVRERFLGTVGSDGGCAYKILVDGKNDYCAKGAKY